VHRFTGTVDITLLNSSSQKTPIKRDPKWL
jgi:hypothetical protein